MSDLHSNCYWKLQSTYIVSAKDDPRSRRLHLRRCVCVCRVEIKFRTLKLTHTLLHRSQWKTTSRITCNPYSASRWSLKCIKFSVHGSDTQHRVRLVRRRVLSLLLIMMIIHNNIFNDIKASSRHGIMLKRHTHVKFEYAKEKKREAMKRTAENENSKTILHSSVPSYTICLFVRATRLWKEHIESNGV